MKFMHIAFLAIMSVALVLSGCEQKTPSDPNNPLVGDWKMERVKIEPLVPVPDFVLNLVISDNPTWTIAPVSGASVLGITYDGREVWFTTPRLGLSDVSVNKQPTTVAAGASKSSITFRSGGTIKVGKVVSIPGLSFRAENINVTYQDSVSVVSSSIDAISATITVNLSGTYSGADDSGVLAPRTLAPYRAVITYTGKRK